MVGWSLVVSNATEQGGTQGGKVGDKAYKVGDK